LFLREYLSTLVPWWQYVLGGMYVLTIFYLPDGVLSTLRQRLRNARSAPAVGARPRPSRGKKLEINEGGIE